MKLIKPKFWEKKVNLISIVLLPFSLFYILIIRIKKKFTKIKKFNIPIICVGNIYIGGTGKTPTSIILCKEILKLGKKPALLRKYYDSHSDEHELIKSKFNDLILCKNRVEELKKLDRSSSDLVIMDDGLQEYKIKKDLNIVCFHSNQLIGNGFTLPAGPLRENLSALKQAHIVIINGHTVKNFEEKILNINSKLEIYYSHYEPINIEKFRNKKLFAIAGIGNPENFFQTLENNNLKVEEKLVLPDHHIFSRVEIENLVKKALERNYKIIMTEKDYFKIKNFKLDNLDYLQVRLQINFKEKLISRIMKLYDQKN